MSAGYPPELPRRRTVTLPPIPTDYDRLELLYEVQSLLAEPCGIDEACDALLPIVTRAIRVRTAALLDTTAGTLRTFMWAAAGVAPAAVEEARDFARKTLEDALQHCIASNVATRTALLQGGVSEPAAPHFAAFPLSTGAGHVFGVFQVEGVAAFTERDALFLEAVSTQIALALDRHHKMQDLATARLDVDHANRRLTDLQEISASALEGATLDDSLSAVLRAICSMFRTDVAAVMLLSEDGKTLRRRASIGLANTGDAEVSVGAGAAGRIAAAGSAVLFDNVDELDCVSPTLQSNGITAMVGAPLRVRNRLIGVVYAASRGYRAFTYDELQFFELVADRIGVIIDNATLYDEALAAIRGRDTVLGIVSHDLRNPLSAIQLCAELLPTNDPELARPVALIKSSVGVMARLISDLRDVESIELGQLSIKLHSENARAFVRDAVEAIRGGASAKSIRLDLRLPTGELVVECDRVRVVQVLTNLLSNALKFTPQGGTITVSLAELDSRHVQFTVADTGCGISEDDLPRVFDRYWQASATAHLGTGVGLAIAKGIVESHGGTISVTSRTGHGTCFTFVLPTSHRPTQDASKARAPVFAKRGVRVLAVDDEQNALSALASLLEDEGFVIGTATDGLRALSKAREFAPDILIVDVEMPGLKGPDLVDKLRKDLAEIPVIYLTGHDDTDFGAPQPHVRHFCKPLDIRTLVSAIHRELDKG